MEVHLSILNMLESLIENGIGQDYWNWELKDRFKIGSSKSMKAAR